MAVVGYKKTKKAVKPKQSTHLDKVVDLYSSTGVLVPPLTFRSVKIPTDIKLKFYSDDVVGNLNINRNIAENTPLLLSEGTRVIGGKDDKQLHVLVRNSFIDNSLVDFAMDTNGNKVYLRDIPPYVLKDAKRFYEEETGNLEYEGIGSEVQKVAYKTVVPRGTIYIAKHERIAQLHFTEVETPMLVWEDSNREW